MTAEEILLKKYHEYKKTWSLPPVDNKYKAMVVDAMNEYAELMAEEIYKKQVKEHLISKFNNAWDQLK